MFVVQYTTARKEQGEVINVYRDRSFKSASAARRFSEKIREKAIDIRIVETTPPGLSKAAQTL